MRWLPLLDHVPPLDGGLTPLVRAVPVVVVESYAFGPVVRAFSIGLEPLAEREGVLGRSSRRGAHRYHRGHHGSHRENQPDTLHPATSVCCCNPGWVAPARMLPAPGATVYRTSVSGHLPKVSNPSPAATFREGISQR